MPTISVIVPVYKVESYLDRCVESILDQTYPDFELILVDDGSPDRCGEMCDAWAAKDSRIKVIHKENGGLSDARNAGIDTARGEYLTFIDSDDYVHPKMLEALYGAVQEHDAKVSACGYRETAGEAISDPTGGLKAGLWTAEDYYRKKNDSATIACAKLYHTDVVLPYPKGKLHEDEYVTYRILFGCGKIAVVEAELYGYFQNNAGITRSRWHPGRMDAFQALEQQVEFFQQIGKTVIARERVIAYWKNICIQEEEICRDRTGSEQAKYRKVCRKKRRFILHAYKDLMGYNLLDHTQMYEAAWPHWKYGIRLLRWGKVSANRLLTGLLGKNGLAAIKKWLRR